MRIVVIGLVLIGVIYRDYILYQEQSVLIKQKTPLTASEQQVMNQDILILTQFKERVWWIGFNPHSNVSDQQLAHIGKMVANLASKYDIYKYAQVLAFNGKKTEAEHQLWILKILHGQENSYQDLLVTSAGK